MKKNMAQDSYSETLRKRRRRVAATRFLAVLLPTAGLALMLIFIFIPFLRGDPGSTPFVRQATGRTLELVLVAIAAVFLVLAGLLKAAGTAQNLYFFETLVSRAERFDAVALGMFMNALEAASGKAGIPEPGLAVLDSDQPNALTFEGNTAARSGKRFLSRLISSISGDGNRPVVGVTRGLLNTRFTFSEAECIVACELGSILTDTYLKRPCLRGFTAYSYTLLGGFTVIGSGSALITSRARSLPAGLLVLAATAILVALDGYLLRLLTGLKHRDHLACDRIGAGICGNAQGLARLIERLDRSVNADKRGRFPGNDLGIFFHFIMPYRWKETAEAYVARWRSGFRREVPPTVAAQNVFEIREAMERLAGIGETLVKVRIEALEEEAGTLSS